MFVVQPALCMVVVVVRVGGRVRTSNGSLPCLCLFGSVVRTSIPQPATTVGGVVVVVVVVDGFRCVVYVRVGALRVTSAVRTQAPAPGTSP